MIETSSARGGEGGGNTQASTTWWPWKSVSGTVGAERYAGVFSLSAQHGVDHRPGVRESSRDVVCEIDGVTITVVQHVEEGFWYHVAVAIFVAVQVARVGLGQG